MRRRLIRSAIAVSLRFSADPDGRFWVIPTVREQNSENYASECLKSVDTHRNRYATPWKVFRGLEKALPEDQTYLKPGLSVRGLDQVAQRQSDTDTANQMQEAKRRLFEKIWKKRSA